MEESPIPCKLKIPTDLNAKTPAFLVDFSNGNLNFRNSNKLKLTCYRHANSRSETSCDKRILVANSGFLNYDSRSNASNSDQKNFNYFIGVRNSSRKRMKIFNTVSFHLKPVFNDDIKVSSEVRNYKERVEDLAMNFGSKEIKRSLVARQKYSLESTSLGKDLENISLNESAENVNSSPSVSNTSNDIDYLPPRNNEAQTVDEVYKINDIISPAENEYLDNMANELLQELTSNLDQWKIDGTFCEYVLNHLEDNNLSHVKAKYLIYYDYLVCFSKLLSSDLRKKDPAQDIPEPLRSCMLDCFTITSTSEYGKVMRTFPLKMKDKILAYILVIALIIDDYFVNLAQVQKGTKYGLPKITNVAQALGCHIRRQSINSVVTSIAELKLPLFVYHKYKKK